MSGFMSDPDLKLLQKVDQVFAVLDPVPELVRQRAVAAFELRQPQATIIPLIDSLPTSVVRGQPADQWISYAGLNLEINLTTKEVTDGWQVSGQVIGLVAKLAAQTLENTDLIEVDDIGRFNFHTQRRTIRFQIQAPDGQEYCTEWSNL